MVPNNPQSLLVPPPPPSSMTPPPILLPHHLAYHHHRPPPSPTTHNQLRTHANDNGNTWQHHVTCHNDHQNGHRRRRTPNDHTHQQQCGNATSLTPMTTRMATPRHSPQRPPERLQMTKNTHKRPHPPMAMWQCHITRPNDHQNGRR